MPKRKGKGAPEAIRGPTILLVDDESTVRDGVGQALESAGYLVARCCDGAQAISWLRLHPTPSVMIGDVHMPGIDGFELRQRARQMRSDLAVLLITGDPEIGSGGPSDRAADQLLRKPFTRAELLDAVGGLIK
jgi:CheY-like chemotaxis protein